MDRLGSNFSRTFDGSHLPQSGAALGVHVGSFVRHLSQPEVADMVEGAITNCSFSMAFSSLSSGLAGNGCRGFLGCESACVAARSYNLAVGDHRNNSRCDSALGCGAICSANEPPPARVGWDVGPDPAPSFRYFPSRRPPVAAPWRQCKSHHVRSASLHIPWGVLGKALESRFPPALS